MDLLDKLDEDQLYALVSHTGLSLLEGVKKSERVLSLS